MRIVRFCLLSVVSLSCAPLFGQALTVAPGLSITNGSIPWALDNFEGKLQLVPIHHSTIEINNHKGANAAGSLAGSVFYKPKLTTELNGLHARSVLHDATPTFYVYRQPDSDPGGESVNSNTSTWAIVKAVLTKDHRVFAKVQFTALTGNAKRTDGVIETTAEVTPEGWLKLIPKTPLEPGEYAVMPILKVANTFSTVVWDFTVDPKAPNASDAVQPDASR